MKRYQFSLNAGLSLLLLGVASAPNLPAQERRVAGLLCLVFLVRALEAFDS